jgi:sialidase-1
MKLHHFIASLLLSCAAFAQSDTPPKSIPVERTLVVSGEGLFPIAIRLRDHRIAVVVRGPGNHLGIDGRLDIVFSSDEGRTWTKPGVVVDTPIDDRNAALGEAKDGTIAVGYYRTATYDEGGKYDPKLDKLRDTWVARSSDGGRTWQTAQIDVSDIGWGSPYGKIVTLPDGAMLMAIYGMEVRPAGEKIANDRNHSYVYRSTDNGRTWKRISEIGDGKLQLNETALLLRPDGKLLAAARSRGGDVWLTESADRGVTWSAPKKLTPVNVHPADLCALKDGRILMTLGNRVRPFGVLGLVSDVGGQFKWEDRFTLVDDAVTPDCGYPSSVVLDDGRVLTLYYASRAKAQPEWKVHCGALTYRVP